MGQKVFFKGQKIYKPFFFLSWKRDLTESQVLPTTASWERLLFQRAPCHTFSSEETVSLSLDIKLHTWSRLRLRNSSPSITSGKCCSVPKKKKKKHKFRKQSYNTLLPIQEPRPWQSVGFRAESWELWGRREGERKVDILAGGKPAF